MTRSSSTSGTTPTMRRGRGLPKSGSTQVIVRFTAFPSGEMRSATLRLTMTTSSLPARSSSLKSRPATTGSPTTAK